MSTLTPALEAALSARAVLMFCALEVALPGHSLRLLSGPSEVTFAGRTFVGKDATYGALGAIEAVSDGGDSEAPELTITIFPPTLASAASLASPSAQGAAVTVWVGALDLVSGEVIDAPIVLFVGEIDVPTLTGDATSRALQYTVTSEFERLFEVDDGANLNNSFHQSVWPGELGCEYVTEVQRTLPWGSEAARPAAVRDVIS